MSQATRIRTQIVDKDYLVATLEGLGHAVHEGHLEIRGFGGKRIRVEVKIRSDNPAYDIGFARVGEAFKPMADWKGLAKVDPDKLHRRVLRCYCYHAARGRLAQRGYAVVSEELDDELRIHLVLATAEQAKSASPGQGPGDPPVVEPDAPPPLPAVHIEACIEQDGHVRIRTQGLAEDERLKVMQDLLTVLGGQIEAASPGVPDRNPAGLGTAAKAKPLRPNAPDLMAG